MTTPHWFMAGIIVGGVCGLVLQALVLQGLGNRWLGLFGQMMFGAAMGPLTVEASPLVSVVSAYLLLGGVVSGEAFDHRIIAKAKLVTPTGWYWMVIKAYGWMVLFWLPVTLARWSLKPHYWELVSKHVMAHAQMYFWALMWVILLAAYIYAAR